jgi:hypothetical protein
MWAKWDPAMMHPLADSAKRDPYVVALPAVPSTLLLADKSFPVPPHTGRRAARPRLGCTDEARRRPRPARAGPALRRRRARPGPLKVKLGRRTQAYPLCTGEAEIVALVQAALEELRERTTL